MRPVLLGTIAALIVSVTALVLIPVGLATGFQARRLYSRLARVAALAILWIYGIRVRLIHESPFPAGQAVFISNHTSTLDLFILVALGLPNCRFFLSGFLKAYVPLGPIAWMMGTFFTVPQNRPEERRRIFQRADRILRRTRESVYLSPEGGRITTGEIGHFNKGAFHLAISLRAPIVPLYFEIPKDVDPGRGYDARPGAVTVRVLAAVDTATWTLDDLNLHVDEVRTLFVRLHRPTHV